MRFTGDNGIDEGKLLQVVCYRVKDKTVGLDIVGVQQSDEDLLLACLLP